MKALREEVSSLRLRALPAPRPHRPKEQPGVIEQVRVALKPHNRMAALLGAALGGFFPIASWQISHAELDPVQSLPGQLSAWLLLAALLFSAPNVYGWGRVAFGSAVKAVGFCALLEGVLVASHTAWLSGAALAYLVAVNAVATGTRLSRVSQTRRLPAMKERNP